MKWKTWLYGLAAAFIGGGAAGVTAGATATLVAPETFNLQAGLHNLILIVVVPFFIQGILHAAGYLAQSPLPPVNGNGGTPAVK